MESKHLTKDAFYQLPSGALVHPCRLIFKDGTPIGSMLCCGECLYFLPLDQAHEAHIVKTAQRLEELNTWVSQSLEPWECLHHIIGITLMLMSLLKVFHLLHTQNKTT